MTDNEFIKIVKEIRERDTRFSSDAYAFLREALDFTAKELEKPADGAQRHISARELLEGIRIFSLKEFGPMTLTVLNSWGVQTTEDIGALVFNLVDAGVLRKTADDRIEDFKNGFDFKTAFDTPFCSRNKDGKLSQKDFTTADYPLQNGSNSNEQ